jgi:hypothetical protein
VGKVEGTVRGLAAPFILVWISVARLFQRLLAALVTLLVANVRRVPVDFAAAMRIAALAITPATAGAGSAPGTSAAGSRFRVGCGACSRSATWCSG